MWVLGLHEVGSQRRAHRNEDLLAVWHEGDVVAEDAAGVRLLGLHRRELQELDRGLHHAGRDRADRRRLVAQQEVALLEVVGGVQHRRLRVSLPRKEVGLFLVRVECPNYARIAHVGVLHIVSPRNNGCVR